MVNKKIGVSFVFLLSLIFLISFVFAESCWITGRQGCIDSGDYIIMGLSGQTNAHGQTWNAGGVCDGVVTPCNDIDIGSYPPESYIENCEAQEGCKFAGTCKDDSPLSATPCNSIIDPEQCGETELDAQFGCSWTGPTLYPFVLCCDVDPGSRACTGEPQTDPQDSSTQILTLSSNTNAHAEMAYANIYDLDVCHPFFECISRPDGASCGTFTEILSLSGTSTSNSHIGAPTDYPNKICCDVNYLGESLCQDGAPDGDYWGPGPPDFGTEECDSGEHCTDLCACETFYISVGDGSCEWDGAAGLHSYWSDTYDGALNLGTKDEIPNLYVGRDTIYMSLIDYPGTWSTGDIITLEVWENDFDFGTGLGDDAIRVGLESLEAIVIDGSIGLAIGNWTVTQLDLDKTKNDYEEFYFKAFDDTSGYEDPFEKSSPLKLTSVTTIICSAVGLCMDYRNELDCENDACVVGPFSVNLNSPTIDCTDPNVICTCNWNSTAGSCGAMWGNEDGICQYTEDTSDDCADMFLKYIMTATWTGGGEPPAEQPPECADGENVIPCPAKVQLSFFNIYKVVAVVIILVIIYLALNLRKNKPKVSKAKKRKKK